MKLDREKAKNVLLDHHSSQEYYPQNQYPNVVNANGQYLGPYIPYIGKSYFDSNPRVLIYAMAQNLARAPRLVKAWLEKPDRGLLRQYYDQATPHVHVNPYDDGHLKVIAALTLTSYPRTSFEPTYSVDDLVAVTNLVKFSFYQEGKDGSHLDANPPQGIYGIMWKCYSKYEIELLQPDIIIGVGNEVSSALKRGLEQDGKHNILVKIPFPGRLNLNSRWVPEGKLLIRTKDYDPKPDKTNLRILLQGTPDRKGLIRRAIEIDWYYFKEMRKRFARKLDQDRLSITKHR